MASVVDRGAGPSESAWTPSTGGEVRVAPAPRRRRRRVSASLGVAVVAGILAMLFTLAAGRQGDAAQVAIAARDIRPGERLSVDDLRYADISTSDSVLAGLVPRSEARSLVGQVAVQPIGAGTMVARSALAPEAGPDQQRAMSFAVEAERAVGGALRTGDRIDVIDGSLPAYVLTGAEILAVVRPSSGALTAQRGYSITVAVDEQSALRLAAAIQAGKLEVVRATGAPAIVPLAGADVEDPQASAGSTEPAPAAVGGLPPG